MSSIIGKNERIRGCCGTPHFISPEILLTHCSNLSSDIWSIGVVLYLLYYGELPFNMHDNMIFQQLIKEIINNEPFFYEIEYPNNKEKELHEKFVHILKICLNKDENNRPKANEIINILSEPLH